MKLETLNRDRVLSSVTGDDMCLENKKIDEFFDELFNGMIIETSEDYTESFYFVKKIDNEVKFYMKQDSKYNRLWCDYDFIWSFFKNDIGLNDNDIQTLVKERVEEAFNLKVETPTRGDGKIMFLMVEAFNLKVDTPKIWWDIN